MAVVGDAHMIFGDIIYDYFAKRLIRAIVGLFTLKRVYGVHNIRAEVGIVFGDEFTSRHFSRVILGEIRHQHLKLCADIFKIFAVFLC